MISPVLAGSREIPEALPRFGVNSPRGELPLWPLAAMFSVYLLWWAIGIGDMVWVIMSVPMTLLLLARGRVHVPRGFGWWLLFLAWVVISVVEIDTGGRLIGFIYRLGIYTGATVTFVYVYNCEAKRVSLHRIAVVMTVFWVTVVFGGFLAIVFPQGSITTPMLFVVPHSLLNNELVHQILLPHFTQGDPDGYFHLARRPSAPFAYANGWGTNYTLSLPFVFIALPRLRGRIWFWPLVVLLPMSLVPAFMTQNRGMLLALAVGLVYVALRQLRRGHGVGLLTVLLFFGAAGAVNAVVPVGDLIQQRLSRSATNETRLAVYREAVDRTLESPLIGRGAPRPSRLSVSAPSVGTQGQFWNVLFSHGFVGAGLFCVWFFGLALRTAWAPTAALLWLHTLLVMMCLESFYYGMVHAAIVITMIAGAAALRERAVMGAV